MEVGASMLVFVSPAWPRTMGGPVRQVFRYLDKDTLLCVLRTETPAAIHQYQIPFIYERCGHIAIKAKNMKEAVQRAQNELEMMSKRHLEEMSDFLPESVTVDYEGIDYESEENDGESDDCGEECIF